MPTRPISRHEAVLSAKAFAMTLVEGFAVLRLVSG
jgi:hypothetical protein